jgi:rhodanese-related sulfurtransferase
MAHINLSNDELRELMASTPQLQVVDVRTADELRQTGHLAGAMHHPVQHITRWAPLLDFTKPIVFICKSGVRSVYACDYMINELHLNPENTPLYNLTHGMSEWDGDTTLDPTILEEI